MAKLQRGGSFGWRDVVSCYLVATSSAWTALSVSAPFTNISFDGRWLFVNDSSSSSGVVAQADWPCSSLSFEVNAAQRTEVTLEWKALRTHVRFSARQTATGQLVHDEVLHGSVLGSAVLQNTTIVLEPSTTGGNGINSVFTLQARKLTEAEPLAPGVGSRIFEPSVLEIHGVSVNGGVHFHDGDGSYRIRPPPPLTDVPRRAVFLGASDTAGYCVDGTPNTSVPAEDLETWRFQNCDMASPGRVQQLLNLTSIGVQAISGIGLVQNANAKEPWVLGKLTLRDYFNRTLQSAAPPTVPVWDFAAHPPPDFVWLSVGGNDFNHQHGDVPANATFTAAYEEFLLRVFEAYSNKTTIVSVCGQGSPAEAKFDPDNNRCRPCTHVSMAVEAFKEKYGGGASHLRAEYIFVPCDGSVVTGDGDIGCNGHKNRIGQAEVASFVAPRLAAVMGW